MRKWLLGLLAFIIFVFITLSVIYSQKLLPPNANTPNTNPSGMIASPTSSSLNLNTSPSSIPNPDSSLSPTLDTHGATSTLPSPSPSPENSTAQANPDLTVDASGLSKALVIVNTSAGVFKYRFYSNDAPKTVKREIELINKGFYNGLTFHRVVPNFVVQGGDPVGNGTGGSGQKLEAEFNSRRHVEGTVAMARASDPHSADSQFYVSLGTFPHLDHNYTVFGQVVEGMDAVRRIKAGDKMITVVIQNQ